MSHTMTFRGRRRGATATAVVGLLLVGCGAESADEAVAEAPASVATDEAPAFGVVSPGEAAVLAGDPDVTVVDVRTPEEFADGHLEGAILIDFYDDTFVDQLGELDQDGTYLLYCRSGNRSGQATAMMADLGFDRVYDLDGGVIAWDSQGQPLLR